MSETPNLDRTDRRILEALQRDARLPMRELASIAGAAPSTCSERVRRLESRGVITGFHTAVDLGALGRSVEAMVFTQVRPLSRDLIDQFHSDALAMPEVMAVFVLAGGDDFLLHVGVRDVAALHSFLVDNLSSRREVVQFRSSIVYGHGRKEALEDLTESSR
ncbi:Lrp/AsnC family transcriptional regulator [Nocardioides panzhihuensis]|uniref:DNA-binding Lrp family transcriptional regulator n=1 Tax=Nocardioides panzhihuensis TaxID=860243 RepID=A0A7Z0DK20_9ACTN|nr:Lrp/AsnC family transcriptional regulator [Nocardioides panzhihuensis]NYI76767.1 DNA-binding Lrp family transcriptional regulator [Nocardioides panzhihuensis]